MQASRCDPHVSQGQSRCADFAASFRLGRQMHTRLKAQHSISPPRINISRCSMYLSNSLALVGLNVEIYLLPPTHLFESRVLGDLGHFDRSNLIFSVLLGRRKEIRLNLDKFFTSLLFQARLLLIRICQKQTKLRGQLFFSIHKGLNIFNLQFSLQPF